MKPRVRFNSRTQLWECHDDFYIWGRGVTPQLAWCDWKIKEVRRTRQARRFYWNKSDCLEWFSKGCRQMRCFIGGKQIVGYDPATDELILRG